MVASPEKVLTIHLPMPLTELTELAKSVVTIWPGCVMLPDGATNTMLHVYVQRKEDDA